MELEMLILSGLVSSDDFARKVLPYLKEEYFTDQSIKLIYALTQSFFEQYNKPPTKDILLIELENKTGLQQTVYDAAKQNIFSIKEPDADKEWLEKQTEKFCQDRSIHNAILETIQIYDGKSTKNVGAIPELLSSALAVSFDTNIGTDYFADAEKSWEEYQKVVNTTETAIALLNKVMNGGPEKKTLNVIAAETGGGKSIYLATEAAHSLLQGRNVLYITLELSEKKVRERIDANLLDIPISEIKTTPKQIYLNKINKLNKTGRLIVKEYPTASAHVGHFRYLLQELKLKKNFVPEVLIVDYLNICASSRLKAGAVNSYMYVKSIAEELRGLAIEFNLTCWSATQLNRSGYSNSDVDVTNISESMGLPATVDSLFAIIHTEELKQLGQVLFKQLKNRYGDTNYYNTFLVGLDKSKMRFYDLENVPDDKPIFDNTSIGEKHDQQSKFSSLKF